MNPTAATAALGAADTAVFLLRRRHLVRENPRRAAQIAAITGLWAGLAASAAREERTGVATLALAQIIGAGSLVMLGVHLRKGIAGPRVWLSTGLAAAAVVSSFART